MPFITEESGLCVSSTNGSRFTTCAPIVRESDENYVFTEDELKIYIDNGCSDSVSKFDCNFSTKIVDSGRFVKITNSCSLPLEITGLINSDPVKFSLFDYPKYKSHGSIYSSENTVELPVTLNPAESFQIPTFFHPSMADMENANAGNINDLNNQESVPTAFSSRVDIYPGFNISNCSDDQNSCDAYFTLTGTLMCGDFDGDWMSNQGGLIPENIDQLEIDIKNDTCIKKTEAMSFTIEGWTDDLGFMQKLKESVDSYTKTITSPDKNLSEIYGHIGMYGALEGMSKMIEGAGSFAELTSSSLTNEQVVYSYDNKDYSMVVDYNSQKNSVKNIDAKSFNGFFYDIVGDLSAKNQTVFINTDLSTSNEVPDWVTEFVIIADDYESREFPGANAELLSELGAWELRHIDKPIATTHIPVGNSSWDPGKFGKTSNIGPEWGEHPGMAGEIMLNIVFKDLQALIPGSPRPGYGPIREYSDALVARFGAGQSKGIVSIFTADEGDYNDVDFCEEAPIAGAVWIGEDNGDILITSHTPSELINLGLDKANDFIQILELENNNRASFHYVASFKPSSPGPKEIEKTIYRHTYQGSYEFDKNGDAIATFKMFDETAVIKFQNPVNGWEAGTSTSGELNGETKDFEKSNKSAKEIIKSSGAYIIFSGNGTISQKEPSSVKLPDGMQFLW